MGDGAFLQQYNCGFHPFLVLIFDDKNLISLPEHLLNVVLAVTKLVFQMTQCRSLMIVGVNIRFDLLGNALVGGGMGRGVSNVIPDHHLKKPHHIDSAFLSPAHYRQYIFPWVKKIVALAHKYNKPAVLHSCGYFQDIFDDIVDIGFDGRHSYEDNIMPVEEAYEVYGDRIAILGGMDMDFVYRETPENIYRRSMQMLERSAARGGYALGTGNSVADYLPFDHYMAILQAARDS